MSFSLSNKTPILYNEGLSNKTEFDHWGDYCNNPEFLEKYNKINKKNWYYKDSKIEYTHNEFGYRSDKLSEISDNDYILFYGCSYTYGMGLFNEDRYSSIISNYYGVKNINMGICGSGISYHALNSTLFLNYILKNRLRLPKLVVYQYPSWTRMKVSIQEKPKESNSILKQETHNFGDYNKDISPFYKKYWIIDETEPMTESLMYPLQLNLLWHGHGVPVFHMDWGDFNQRYKSDYQSFHIYDYSRFNEHGNLSEEEHLLTYAKDLSHNGRDFNKRVADEIINETKEWLM